MEDRRFGERREFNPYRLSKMKADEERGYVDHNLKVNVVYESVFSVRRITDRDYASDRRSGGDRRS
jgi:hypothetical protein